MIELMLLGTILVILVGIICHSIGYDAGVSHGRQIGIKLTKDIWYNKYRTDK